MPSNPPLPVASIDVLLNGARLDPALSAQLYEVKVRENLTLPASALIRLVDTEQTLIDDRRFAIGTAVEIKVGAQIDTAVTSIFKGEIIALEPEFLQTGVSLAVRAYDKSHKLQRTGKVRTFQQSSASDIVTKLVHEAGLIARSIQTTDVKYEFFQQSGETDRDLIRRFEREYGYQFFVDGDNATFRSMERAPGPTATLRYGDQLYAFRPRISGVQQLQTANVRGWDAKQKQAIVGQGTNSSTVSKPGLRRTQVSSDSGRGALLVADRVVESNQHATALAKATINGYAEAYVEAEGTALGEPDLRAGSKVKIDGVGTRFSGEYLLTSVTHSFRGDKGYYTHFEISGRSPRTLLDLVHKPEKRDWGSHLVIGIVTNHRDPDAMGRVKVKYPTLSDSDESGWARIVTPGAGQNKGLLMMPELDDEVVVAFENGDTRRPLIIGSLFNGRAKPSPEGIQKGDASGKFSAGGNTDGSFGLVAKNRGYVETKKDLTFKSAQKMILQITGDREEKTDANLKSEASQNAQLKAGQNYTIEAGQGVTLKGVNITVEASGPLKLKGATVDIEASGPASFKGATVQVQGSAATNIKGGIINLG